MSGYKERIVIVESEKQLQEHYKIYHSPVDGIWYGRSTIGNTYDGVGTGKVNLFPRLSMGMKFTTLFMSLS